MANSTDSQVDGVVINETIDGVEVNTSSKRRLQRNSIPTRQKADPYIWGIYVMLLVVSVIELYSASSTEVSAANIYMPLIRHGIFLIIGLGCVIGLQNTHYVFFSRFAAVLALGSLGLLIVSNFFGVEINGAQRAIKIAGFTIQPAEIVKLTVVILLSTILGRTQLPRGVSNSGVIWSALVVIIFGACLWKNGLTNTILLFGVSLSMFLIGGMSMKKLGIVLGVYMIFGGGLFLLKYQDDKMDELDKVTKTEMTTDQNSGGRAQTHKGRISRFLEGVNPDDEIDDYNRQVIFSNIAQANGGVFGQGPGNSRESARLPLAFSDYIYSIIVEDTGLVGGVFLLILYLLLLARAGSIAYKCKRAFPAFLIMGCAVLIVFQALVHMAIVTGLFPVSGQPLPLISKGGTSIIVMSCAIGIMLSVSRFAVTTTSSKDVIKEELNHLPEDMQAENFSGYQDNK